VAQAKYRHASIRNERFQLVSSPKAKEDPKRPHWELFDLLADRAEKTNVLQKFPAVARDLEIAYDHWWNDVQPLLVNENVPAPTVNPIKALYWKQFGGGPDQALRRQMRPAR
jgi:arylsulfatase